MGDDRGENDPFLRVVIVEMGGVHISRHHREDIDILARQAARDLGAVADGDLVEWCGSRYKSISSLFLGRAAGTLRIYMRIWRPAST